MAAKINNLLSQESAPDFTDPLGLLKACHQRILGFCKLLEKMCEHTEQHGIDDQIEQSAQKVHRYFSTAAMLHHQDEEQDLFPLLIGTSTKMARIIDGLKKDHIKLDQHWQTLSPALSRPATITDAPEFKQWVNKFCSAYREHIKVEEEDFLALAQHLLSREQLQRLSKNMKQRRE